jgi:hypothetical protein
MDRANDSFTEERPRHDVARRHPAADACLLEPSHDGVCDGFVDGGVTDEHIVGGLMQYISHAR